MSEFQGGGVEGKDTRTGLLCVSLDKLFCPGPLCGVAGNPRASWSSPDTWFKSAVGIFRLRLRQRNGSHLFRVARAGTALQAVNEVKSLVPLGTEIHWVTGLSLQSLSHETLAV